MKAVQFEILEILPSYDEKFQSRHEPYHHNLLFYPAVLVPVLAICFYNTAHALSFHLHHGGLQTQIVFSANSIFFKHVFLYSSFKSFKTSFKVRIIISCSALLAFVSDDIKQIDTVVWSVIFFIDNDSTSEMLSCNCDQARFSCVLLQIKSVKFFKSFAFWRIVLWCAYIIALKTVFNSISLSSIPNSLVTFSSLVLNKFWRGLYLLQIGFYSNFRSKLWLENRASFTAISIFNSDPCAATSVLYNITFNKFGAEFLVLASNGFLNGLRRRMLVKVIKQLQLTRVVLFWHFLRERERETQSKEWTYQKKASD